MRQRTCLGPDRRSVRQLRPLLWAVGLLTLALPTAGRAAADAAEGDWLLRVRGVISGSSTHSDPDGYKAYSGIAVEAGAARKLGRYLALELTLRTESREVDQAQASGPDARLGSLDLLPMSLLLQVIPWHGTFRPYLGAGVNLTVCWEKTGALDDTQVSPSVGPAVQLGLDVAVGEALLLNVDVRWNTLRPEVSRAGAKLATLQIDPLTFGAGVAVRL